MLQEAFEINHSTLLLADFRPTYSFFCPYHIILLLLLFMNGSASFMPHISWLSQWICRWHTCKSKQELWWREERNAKGTASDLLQNQTHLPPALHQNVNIWASFYPWKYQQRENRRPFSKSKPSIKVLALLPSSALPKVFHLDFQV